MLIDQSFPHNYKLQSFKNSITYTEVHQLKHGTAKCERHGSINTAKIGQFTQARLPHKSDDVSFIGRHLALLPSRLKSQGGVLTKPEQLIGLIFAHQ